jgi:GTP-binding protein
MKPLIAIVGRPNVGKSALFNRLVRKRIALVEDFSGTTRDRLYAECDIWGHTCTLIDTGGFDPTDKEGYTPAIREQSQFAIDEADIIIFLTDGREPPNVLDFEIANVLRRTSKPVILAANKLENPNWDSNDHYELRMGDVVRISAASGLGVAELTEKIEELLPREIDNEPEISGTKIAFIGRPNVGKSALTNRLLGFDRSIVSDVAGTTRDAVDSDLLWKNKNVTLIDTAGVRRKSRVRADKTSVEYHMILRSLRAVDRCDVAVLVVESGGIAEQDTKLAGYAHEAGKALIIAVNKWDLLEKEPKSTFGDTLPQKDFKGMIDRYLPFVNYAPVHYISALEGFGVEALLDDALDIVKALKERIPTASLNKVLWKALAEHPPASDKGRAVKIKYATQAETTPPTIVIFCNRPESLHFSYLRYLENRIREAFPFRGVPLKIQVRKSSKDEDR